MAKRFPARAEARGPDEPARVYAVSLGCAKNLVDSEVMLGRIGEAGFAITTSPEDADVLLVNTCGFITSAKEESLEAIRSLCAAKRKSGGTKRVVVVGCLAQRYAEELEREIPDVDAIVGVGEGEEMGTILRGVLEDGRGRRVRDPTRPIGADVGRLRLTPPHYAYVKISEGCDHACTFCAIPAIRGRFRSKPLPAVLDEVRELVASGAREIVLISQDTTSYGLDAEGGPRLPELLEKVAGVPGVDWVRLLYAHPALLSDPVVEVIARTEPIVKYIDLPIQHISSKVLRRMGRGLDGEKTRRLLDRIRERVPGVYIRTTLLVGFPGEDVSDFEELRRFVADFQFERLGVFAYSEEEGTPAARLPDRVPEEVRAERAEEIMLLAQDIAFRQNRRREGERALALVDEVSEAGGGILARARSYGEAPEIDPAILVRLRGPRGQRRRHARGAPQAGDMVRVRISGSEGYDLLAELLPAT